jgi:hypothetical protein
MDPKETKTFESSKSPNPNQTSSKTQKTKHILGVSPLEQSASNTNLESSPKFWAGLRKPMKWAVTIVVPILILALVVSGLFNLVQGLMKGENTPQSIPTTPTNDRSTSSPSSIVASTSKNECLDLPTRMAQSKITIQEVDKVFHQKYPDRTNKALGDTQLDRNLRQEWCAIGNRLSNTKLPSR